MLPSKTIAKGFETVIVVTDDGRQFSGVFQSEDDNQLRLVTPEGKPLVVQKRSIEERRTGAERNAGRSDQTHDQTSIARSGGVLGQFERPAVKCGFIGWRVAPLRVRRLPLRRHFAMHFRAGEIVFQPRAAEDENPQCDGGGQEQDADVLRNRHAGAADQAFVGADAFFEDSHDRVDRDQQRRHFAVVSPQGIPGQQK